MIDQLLAVRLTLLQSGSGIPTPETPYTAPIGDYADGGLLDAVINDVVAASGGEAMFAVLIIGLVNLCYWVAGGRDLALPAVFTIATAFMAFPLLPGRFLSIARALIVLGVASLLLELARRYVMDPGTR